MSNFRGPVAIIGGNGQLGTDLNAEFLRRGVETRSLTHADIQIENSDSVRALLSSIRPSAVVNCAAFHVVPKCEELPDDAWRVNSLGALHVARAAADIGAVNVFVSTDYVFDGAQRTPYLEGDRPNPLNVYGVTKLAGEHFTLATGDQGVVVRVSGIYGAVPSRSKGGNFITTMLKAAKERPEVKVVNDEFLTPTPTKSIAVGISDLLEAGGRGVFHMSCEGECSWYDFARVIFDELSLKTPLIPASVKDFPPTVRRPHYSVLENGRMRELGLAPLPPWREALVAFLRGNMR